MVATATLSELRERLEGQLNELEDTLDSIGNLATDEITLEFVAPMIRAQGQLQKAIRVLGAAEPTSS